jgi:hypothetical protein
MESDSKSDHKRTYEQTGNVAMDGNFSIQVLQCTVFETQRLWKTEI